MRVCGVGWIGICILCHCQYLCMYLYTCLVGKVEIECFGQLLVAGGQGETRTKRGCVT